MKKVFFLLVAILLSAKCLSANTIVYNATIYTVNEKQPYASALVVEGKKIVYVGDDKTALTYKNKSSILYDAQKKFIMPGFIDSHTHYALVALFENMGVNLLNLKGQKAIMQKLRDYKKANPNLDVYTGFGFYPYAFGPNGPTKELLDEVFPEKKAFFMSNNAHKAWANSKALEFLGINKNTPDPLKNIYYYERDKDGNPTGLLHEGEALWPHFKTLGIGSSSDFKSALEPFLQQAPRYGITTIFDAATPEIEENAYQELHELDSEGKLLVRFLASHFLLTKEELEGAAAALKKLQKKYDSNLFHVSSHKMINDNSDDDNYQIVLREKELIKYLLPIAKMGDDVMIHTMHDSGIHQALNAIEAVKKVHENSPTRFTLTHVNMVRDDDFKRFKELGVIANIQPFDAQGDGYYEYRYMLYEEEYDGKWNEKLARFKHFFEYNITLSASSDYPACNNTFEGCSPWYGIEISMTRQAINSTKKSPVLASKKERLSLKEAIEAYTINGAYQLHMENVIGSLERGKEADFIVLDKNPFHTNTYELHTLKVLKTMLQGRFIYSHTLSH